MLESTWLDGHGTSLGKLVRSLSGDWLRVRFLDFLRRLIGSERTPVAMLRLHKVSVFLSFLKGIVLGGMIVDLTGVSTTFYR